MACRLSFLASLKLEECADVLLRSLMLREIVGSALNCIEDERTGNDKETADAPFSSRLHETKKAQDAYPELSHIFTGAEEETRTLTPERELDPEPSVSTNFTTSAQECK